MLREMNLIADKNKTPPFMRTSVSRQFLTHNPNYKDVFKQCPACNQFSFVNIDMNGNKTIIGRVCRNCGNKNDVVD